MSVNVPNQVDFRLKPQKKSPSADLLVEFERRISPIHMSPDEFLWFLKALKLKQTTFAEQIGCTPRTIYNERQREYVRESWSEKIKNTIGTKLFKRMRRLYNKEKEEFALKTTTIISKK